MMQLCEAGFYGTSTLLGKVAEQLGADAVTGPLGPALAASNATFKRNDHGRWRFAFLDDRGEVNTLAKQRELFLKCSGLKGAWTDPTWKEHAKLWAACMANVWQNDGACRIQISHVKQRLKGFIYAAAQQQLFDDPNQSPWARALRAIYLSYAVSNPTMANAQLRAAVGELKSPKWSPDWCTGVVKRLVYGGNVAIYPIRHNATRGVAKRLWGVDLPDASALKDWVEPQPLSQPEPRLEATGDTPPPPETKAEVVHPAPVESVEQLSGELKQPDLAKPEAPKPWALLAWIKELLAAFRGHSWR